MLTALLAATAVLALLTLVPGPDMAVVTQAALGAGRSAGFRVAAGIVSGLLVWGLLTVLGLSAILAAGGTTMVLATHEMAFAREVATTVCFLEGGRILEQGPPDRIFTRPGQERTRAFLRRVLPS